MAGEQDLVRVGGIELDQVEEVARSGNDRAGYVSRSGSGPGPAGGRGEGGARGRGIGRVPAVEGRGIVGERGPIPGERGLDVGAGPRVGEPVPTAGMDREREAGGGSMPPAL